MEFDVRSLPQILNMPPKLYPMVTRFNEYDYFLGDGGRGSAKSHSVARFLLYLGERKKLRIVCGREIQANIEESVYTLLKDLISQHDLAYDVFAHKIRHRVSLTEFSFKGFREQGAVNVKGLEGVDILWIDEAQSITKTTLDVIMPTIRKAKARIYFTMNRFMRDDAVPELLVGNPRTLHIQINYFENPFCPLSLKVQAEEMKAKSLRDYNHIWLGQPLASADDYLFNYEKLHKAFEIKPYGDIFTKTRQRVLSIDMAAQGNDQCVATVLDRMSNQHWQVTERLPWDEPDTMISVGKIVNLIGTHKPTVVIMDISGLGKPVYDRLNEVLGTSSTVKLVAFDGGSTSHTDQEHYANNRAQGYFLLRDWFDSGFLCLDKKDMEIVKQLEKIKFKYRSNGVKIIQAKVDMKKELRYSPDDADSLMMAVFGAVHYLGKSANDMTSSGAAPVRISRSRRGRK